MLFFWSAFALVLALDQYTKHLIVRSFQIGESRIAIPHLLWWTYVQNHRGAFGLFGPHTWFLIILSIAVLAAFWLSFGNLAVRSPAMLVAFGAIVGGAVGNMIDRFHYTYVVDFIDLRWWPVFNVADSFITLGVLALLLITTRQGETAPSSSTK